MLRLLLDIRQLSVSLKFRTGLKKHGHELTSRVTEAPTKMSESNSLST